MKKSKKVFVPGSKSISNRVLILAALSKQPTILTGLLDSDDIVYMKNLLVNLGVVFEESFERGEKQLKVIPPKRLTGNNSDNFIGNAGTASRFGVALSLITEGAFTLRGVDRMHERPFQDLFTGVEALGVEVEYLGDEAFLPVRFLGSKFEGSQTRCAQTLRTSKFQTQKLGEEISSIDISGKISSQFITALMLVAPKLKSGLTINITDSIPSRPYIEMTLEILKIWGVNFFVNNNFTQFKIEPGMQSPRQFHVAADSSSASYPILYSVLSGKPLVIENFGAVTLQGDEQFLEVAEKSGAQITRSGDRVEIVPPDTLKPLGNIDFESMPDVSMTGMILAAFADGTSHFTGLESLRVKECDRIAAMAEGLIALGVKVEVIGDEVIIHGEQNLRTKNMDKMLKIDSRDDHRIAMVFGVFRSITGINFEISQPECVAKTWPDFWVELAYWEESLRDVSAVILQKKNKYLIVRKPRKDNAWQFPQGGVDPGESGVQAAKRELQEECGASLNVKFKGEKPVGSYQYLFPENFKRHDANIKGAKVQFFCAEYLEGEVEVDGEEIVEYKWVSREVIKDFFDSEYWEQVQGILH